MTEPRLLGIAGALRAGSTNRMLLAEAMRAFGPCRAETADIRMPLYDGDAEDAEGLPPEAQRLVEQIRAADAVVISTPEYNKSFPGVLKNALDWISRARPGPLTGKPMAIMSAADGRAGGERSQFALRLTLVPYRPDLVSGPEVLVGNSSEAFDEEGRLIDPRYRRAVEALMAALRAKLD
ncbi:NADPH-dependent FMN reductase [Frigidibacter sp. ROC022]|uniref:NADPH-dependent FMN reductase n=1 Tax=Frigidibacter sp. ROC022 TaxID=2971796 RepID=UPI00215A3FC3|nr:NAD(P)H-dependent oxidoreductase [Frigidibacter sp. ROC022]MCR8726507.1 NAD(P)H-dependent oxidoreductase [Frigidibacter sp. ROC022]